MTQMAKIPFDDFVNKCKFNFDLKIKILNFTKLKIGIMCDSVKMKISKWLKRYELVNHRLIEWAVVTVT